LRILVTLLLCAVAACALFNRPLLAFFRSETSTNVSQRTLTFAERAAYQRAIEDVYWRHRIWPKENPNPKPSLDAVMSQAQIEKKVTDYLRKSQALEITGNGRLQLSNCKLRWIAWQATPNSPKYCANFLPRSGMIHLL
jgi:hypothetical protein